MLTQDEHVALLTEKDFGNAWGVSLDVLTNVPLVRMADVHAPLAESSDVDPAEFITENMILSWQMKYGEEWINENRLDPTFLVFATELFRRGAAQRAWALYSNVYSYKVPHADR